jgi:E3 ubiquitin-protein ligase BRE1
MVIRGIDGSLKDRISTLESQLQRAKVKLAANVGREDIVNFLLETPDKDIQFVDHLQARLAYVLDSLNLSNNSIIYRCRDTEARLLALEEALLKLKRDHPDVAQHIQSEAEALQKLTQATTQLTKYQNVYGELSGSSPDQMARELQRKEEEIRRLRLLDSQHAQVCLSSTFYLSPLIKISFRQRALYTPKSKSCHLHGRLWMVKSRIKYSI